MIGERPFETINNQFYDTIPCKQSCERDTLTHPTCIRCNSKMQYEYCDIDLTDDEMEGPKKDQIDIEPEMIIINTIDVSLLSQL